MEMSAVQAIKLAIVSTFGLSRDALHIYVGMAMFLAVIVSTRRLRPYFAWLSVLALACLGEGLDWRDDLADFGYWKWKDSVHDVVNTLFWPSVMTLMWILKSRLWSHGADLPRNNDR